MAADETAHLTNRQKLIQLLGEQVERLSPESKNDFLRDVACGDITEKTFEAISTEMICITIRMINAIVQAQEASQLDIKIANYTQ